MGNRTKYEPGTFCWVDLATTDADAAKSFYGELFGWTYEDMPTGEDSSYSMMSLDGDVVAGLFDMGDEMRASGFPATWQSYVNVEDAGAVTSRVSELGGKVIEEPIEIPGSGRTAVIRDPEGSSEFYSNLFGWKTTPQLQDGETVYVSIGNGGSENGGMMPMTERHGDMKPYWLVYFTTESIDESVEKVQSLGGGVMAGPMEIMPGSRIAIVHDPQGAAFALFDGETDD